MGLGGPQKGEKGWVGKTKPNSGHSMTMNASWMLALLCAAAIAALAPTGARAEGPTACSWRPDRCLACPTWEELGRALPTGLYLSCVTIWNDTCDPFLAELVATRYLGPTRVLCQEGVSARSALADADPNSVPTSFVVGLLSGGAVGLVLLVLVLVRVAVCWRTRKVTPAPSISMPMIPSDAFERNGEYPVLFLP